ncbi:tetratricopeptide repeat-containing sensor histidine kinase [Chryseobacterium sp. CT-SW4]|uniref:tetratricopeptide repeat-containing sensor histidine kinase n=1 Tax=Chryseobacterium sp. SW-1 TaxID=3157343 RepID=UPI003B01CB04
MKNLITIILILTNYSFYAQRLIPLNEKHYIDSLQQVTRSNTDPILRANAHFILSGYYRNIDSVISKEHLQKGEVSGKKDPYTIAKYYYYEGLYYQDRNAQKAAASYQKALSLLPGFKTEEAQFFQALSWYNYGVTQKNKEGYPFLVKILLEKSIPLVDQYTNNPGLGYLYSQLGIILTYNAEFEKSARYNQTSRELLEKIAPRSSELFNAYLHAATNFCYQAKGDEAKKYIDKAEKLLTPYPDSSYHAPFYYITALYFITKQKNAEALPIIEKGLFYSKKYKQSMFTQMFYVNKYDILRKLNKYPEAKAVLESTLNEKTLLSDANNRKTIYYHLSAINELMGNDREALDWQRKYSSLSDSLNTENVKLEINQLETKFNTAEKEKKIATLNAEKREKELLMSKKNSYLRILGLAALLFLSLLIFIFLLYRKNRKISEQKEINLQQKIQDIKQKEELNLTKAIMESEERERERIARDLHDGLGGMLAGVKINLSTWSYTHLNHDQQKDLQKITHQLDHSVTELRNIARNLMPESLLHFGLKPALKDLCEFYTRKDLIIECQLINIGSGLPLSTQMNIYRIIQELLANAVKHSEASSILLQCSQSPKSFMITIEDNGKGFREVDHTQSKSMGLRNLRNRVEYLKGEMEISSDTAGTAINIELNIKENE